MSDITTEPYLAETDIIDFSDPDIHALSKNLAEGCASDSEIAKKCFEYVRDEIRHSGDYRDNVTTCRASEVLKCGTGWCYAKSHLLAALLRANGIPAGFCYQRLSCSEYRDGIYCLHGLNAVYLQAYGWYRIDARGNKEGVDAQFTPPHERLAFELQEGESDLPEILAEPLDVVIKALRTRTTYDAMVDNFPDIKEIP
jgi:transglutaminase-like putative cysteine protease